MADTLGTLAIVGLGLFALEKLMPGTVNKALAPLGIQVPLAANTSGIAPAGANPAAVAAAKSIPDPTPEELARALGVSVYKVREAMRRSGKTTGQLTTADFAEIPQVPAVVYVNGVPSYPNPSGPPATFDNPTGGSSSWGGLTADQIKANFLAAAGGDEAKARAMWEAQHRAEVEARGF